MTNKEFLIDILKNIKGIQKELEKLDKRVKLIEQKKTANSNEPASKIVLDAEENNKKHRLQRRKKQVKEAPEKVLSVIESKHWKFSKVKRDTSKPGFVWKCKDKDGIVITGSVDIDATKIQFDFENEIVEFSSELSSKLEEILVNGVLGSEIYFYRKNKKEIYGNKTYPYDFFDGSYLNQYRAVREYSKSGKHCIYCNTSISSGSICYSCQGNYSKKRKGVGGYPTYDSNS